MNLMHLGLSLTLGSGAGMVSGETPPGAPQNLVAENGADSVVLTWDAMADVLGFKVYRNGLLLETLADPDAVGTEDATAVSLVEYDYTVKAYNGGGDGDPSNEETIEFIAPVSGLVVDTKDSTSITLAWDAYTGSPDTFRLQAQEAGGDWGSLVANTTASQTASGLAGETAYDLRVRVEDNADASVWVELLDVETTA